MKKAILEYFPKFIFGVLVIVIAYIAIKKAYIDASTKILESLGIYKPTKLERAIICSYYRCYYGLGGETESKCKDFFTESPYLPSELEEFLSSSEDYKICNELSFAVPVKVEISQPVEIRRSMLDQYLKGLKCVVYRKSSFESNIFSGILDAIPPIMLAKIIRSLIGTAFGLNTIVYLNVSSSGLGEYKSVECEITDMTKVKNAIDNAILLPGTYYISTSSYGNVYTVVLQKKNPRVLSMNSGESVEKVLYSNKYTGDINELYIIDVGDSTNYLVYFYRLTNDNELKIKIDKIDNNKDNAAVVKISEGNSYGYPTSKGAIFIEVTDIIRESGTCGFVCLGTDSYEVHVKIKYVA